MSSISGISGASSAWSSMIAMRGHRPPGGMDPAKMYAKVDSDGSGGVDKTELQTMLDDISEKTGTSISGTADELFSKMDSDGDGTLSQAELDEGMKNLLPPPSTMDFAQSRGAESGTDGSDDLFGKIDSDGDGKVSSDELQALFDKMGVEEDATERFAELDTDGDGSLSQAEFEAGRPQGGMPPPPPARADASDGGTDALQALLAALDTNGDQQVSDDEAQSFLDKLNEEQQAAQSSSQGSEATSQRLTELVRQAYAQIAGSFSGHAYGSTVNATA